VTVRVLLGNVFVPLKCCLEFWSVKQSFVTVELFVKASLITVVQHGTLTTVWQAFATSCNSAFFWVSD